MQLPQKATQVHPVVGGGKEGEGKEEKEEE